MPGGPTQGRETTTEINEQGKKPDQDGREQRAIPPPKETISQETRIAFHPEAPLTERIPPLSGKEALIILTPIIDRYQNAISRRDNPQFYSERERQLSEIDHLVIRLVEEAATEFDLSKKLDDARSKWKETHPYSKEEPTDGDFLKEIKVNITPSQRRLIALILQDTLQNLEAASGLEIAYTGISAKHLVTEPKIRISRFTLGTREIEVKEPPAKLYKVYKPGKAIYDSPFTRTSGFTELDHSQQQNQLIMTKHALDTLLEQTGGIGRHLASFEKYVFFTDIKNAQNAILQERFGNRRMAQLSPKEQFMVQTLALERLARSYGQADLDQIIQGRIAETAKKFGSEEKGRIRRALERANELKRTTFTDTEGNEVNLEFTQEEYKRMEEAVTLALEGKDGAEEALRLRLIELVNLTRRKNDIPKEIGTIKKTEIENLERELAKLPTNNRTPEQERERERLEKAIGNLNNRINELNNELENDIPRRIFELRGGPDPRDKSKHIKGEIDKLEEELNNKISIYREAVNRFDEYKKLKKQLEQNIQLAEQIKKIVNAAKNISTIQQYCFDIHARTDMLTSFDTLREYLMLDKDILSDYQLGQAVIQLLKLPINPQLLSSNSPQDQEFARTQILVALRGLPADVLADQVVGRIIDGKLAAAEVGRPRDLGPLEASREWYLEKVTHDKSQDALMQKGYLPGVNCIQRTFEIDGKRYAVVAKDGKNELILLEAKADGNFEPRVLSTLGTRDSNYTEGATAEVQAIRNRIFTEILYDSLAKRIKRGEKDIPGGPRTSTLYINTNGEILIQSGQNVLPIPIREYVKRLPNSPDAQALAALGRAELQKMEDLSKRLQTLEKTKHITTIIPEEDKIVIESVSYQNPNFRIVFEITGSGIKVKGQDKDTQTGEWKDVPLNTSLNPELSLEEFVALDDKKDNDAFRRRTLSGIFNHLARLTPEERAMLNMESVRIDLDFTFKEKKRFIAHLECGIDENGEFYAFDLDHPDKGRLDLISEIQHLDEIFDNFTSYNQKNQANSIMRNPLLTIQSALARRYLETLQRRMTIR